MSEISYKHGAVNNYITNVYNRTFTRLCKSLISGYNVHCHLLAEMNFVEFTARCRWNWCVAEYFCLCLSVHTQASGSLYNPFAPICNFNGHEKIMHQRHLTAEITELMARTSLVRPTSVNKCGRHTYIFRALSGHISYLCFIYFVLSCSRLGSPVVDISTTTNRWKWIGLQKWVGKRKINGTEMHMKSATEEENSEEYRNVCI